jgi:hypothetical protein
LNLLLGYDLETEPRVAFAGAASKSRRAQQNDESVSARVSDEGQEKTTTAIHWTTSAEGAL